MTQSAGRKTIFITGAGSGIGRATAILFAARGWFCGLYDANAEGLVVTASHLPEGAWTTGVFDVRDKEGWRDAIGQFGDSTGGQMDVLFNNAGIGRHGPFELIPQDDSDLVIDVNIKGVVNGVYAALPLLRQTANSCIVNTASAAGVFGSPSLAVYSATKFAVRGLTEALDVEFARFGVRVHSLMPWIIETPILDMPSSTGANRVMRDGLAESGTEIYKVEDAAQAAWAAAHGDQVHTMVGKAAERVRFMARFFPNFLRKQMKKQFATM
jgi:NAD(P)-dependent dehydrogenase (short-subunit alcohol dehydrogenase family)